MFGHYGYILPDLPTIPKANIDRAGKDAASAMEAVKRRHEELRKKSLIWVEDAETWRLAEC